MQDSPKMLSRHDIIAEIQTARMPPIRHKDTMDTKTRRQTSVPPGVPEEGRRSSSRPLCLCGVPAHDQSTAQRAAGLRPPRLGRIADARRQAPVRWMIPRFDRDRFNVSLVSLRKKDLSEETLEALGVDITYLERSKFDPLTLPALLASSIASRSTSCTCTATAPRRSAGWRRRGGGFRRSFTSTPTSPTRPGFRRSPTVCSSRTPTSPSPSRRAPPTS